MFPQLVICYLAVIDFSVNFTYSEQTNKLQTFFRKSVSDIHKEYIGSK